MSFLGLGSFGTGFVTGLAESADKALQDSINRINTRVDKLKQFQVERAIKEQDKRAAEVEETKEALERAYALFDGDKDAERAISLAGGLLKERGGLAAFNTEIAKLQEAKDNGTDIFQFFDRATTDVPTASLSDIAEASVGAPRTLPKDYRIPEGMKGERSLVGTLLGKDIDVVQKANREAAQEINALYTLEPKEFATLPSITYKAERFNLRNKTTQERLTYVDEKLNQPEVQNNPKLLQKYREMRVDFEKAVINTKVESDVLTVKKRQLDRMDKTDPNYSVLKSEIRELKRTIDIKALDDKPIAKLELQIEHALQDAYDIAQKNNTEVDLSNVENLRNELATLQGTELSVEEEFKKQEEALERQLVDGDINQDTYKKEMLAIAEQRKVIEENKPLPPASGSQINQYTNILSTINEDIREAYVEDNFSVAEIASHKKIADLVKGDVTLLDKIRREAEDTNNAAMKNDLKIYDQINNAQKTGAYDAVLTAIANLRKNVKREELQAFLGAAQAYGYVDPTKPSTDTPTDTSTSTVTGEGASNTNKVVTIADKNIFSSKFPTSKAGVNRLLTTYNLTAQEALDDESIILRASPEFIQLLRQETPTYKDAQETETQYEKEAFPTKESLNNIKLDNVVDKVFPNRFFIGDNSILKNIQEELNVSESEARQLLPEIKDRIKQKETQQAEERKKEQGSKRTPVKVAKELKKAIKDKNEEQYNKLIIEYAGITNRTVDEVKNTRGFIFPTTKLNTGGLMSRSN